MRDLVADFYVPSNHDACSFGRCRFFSSPSFVFVGNSCAYGAGGGAALCSSTSIAVCLTDAYLWATARQAIAMACIALTLTRLCVDFLRTQGKRLQYKSFLGCNNVPTRDLSWVLGRCIRGLLSPSLSQSLHAGSDAYFSAYQLICTQGQ